MKNKNLILFLALVMVMVLSLFSGCTEQAEVNDEAEMTEETENTTEVEEVDEEEMDKEDDEMDSHDDMAEDTMEEELMLTLDELKMYDGTNGNPAYVAYDGVIYDVTNDPNWASGSHGGNMVGTDITEKLNSAPHGTSKLSQVNEVGKLVE